MPDYSYSPTFDSPLEPMQVFSCWEISKDGNGDPISESPRGILPLGDGDEGELIPSGWKC
jgi:hypothetical protein